MHPFSILAYPVIRPSRLCRVWLRNFLLWGVSGDHWATGLLKINLKKKKKNLSSTFHLMEMDELASLQLCSKFKQSIGVGMTMSSTKQTMGELFWFWGHNILETGEKKRNHSWPQRQISIHVVSDKPTTDNPRVAPIKVPIGQAIRPVRMSVHWGKNRRTATPMRFKQNSLITM